MNLAVRIAAPARPLMAPLVAQVLDLAAMAEQAPAWDRLAAAADYANPFHGRAVLLAHEAHGLLDPRLRFLAVAEEGMLRALLPFVPRGAWTGLRRSHRVWLPPHFAVNGTPLVASATLEAAAESLLDGMAREGGLWRVPLLSLDSRAGEALMAACRRRGYPIGLVAPFDRAVLRQGASHAEHMRDRVSASRRKGLRRRLRRLEEQGRVAFAIATEGEGLADAVEAFLDLEAAGWKGRRGTALAARERAASLTRALFAAPDGVVTGRADVLTLDDRPIAVSLALLCGGTAFLLKTAYDERLRRFAPGLLLEEAILRAFLDGGFAEKLDSASLPGCILEELFCDRERMADLVIATRPGFSQAALARLLRQERLRRSLMGALKKAYWALVEAASGAGGK